jgi:hypothetical protein
MHQSDNNPNYGNPVYQFIVHKPPISQSQRYGIAAIGHDFPGYPDLSYLRCRIRTYRPKTKMMSFKKRWVRILIILLIVGAAIQLIRPTIENPPVTADISAPPAVEQILQRDCYDCHSNETKLLWFDEITPANFLVAGDIRSGRQVLNFSHWDSLSKDAAKGKLFESLNQASFGVMPLSDYTRFHGDARISPQDLLVLRSYLTSLTPGLRSDSSNAAKAAAGDAQYAKWIATTSRSGEIQAALNGMTFPADFGNWTAISTTDRWDNGTMRVIFGNDVAVKAIRVSHTNPWPDGSVFAKAAWAQVVDSSGIIRPGAFLQVEFMIRDKQKYSGTDGWGFARWVKGLDLVPYGKTAGFTSECVNCHKPMRHNDFVFTEPIQPRDGKVITSGIDKLHKTMFTLYGNNIAATAKAGPGAPYPPGAVLSLVTWAQREDPHWFGANIPGSVQSIETVTFKADKEGHVQPAYETSTAAATSANGRLDDILHLKASVLP